MLTKNRASMLVAAGLAVAVTTACGSGSETDEATTIKIGVTAPLTGPSSTLSPAAEGVEAYFKKLNAEGGINGFTFDVIVKDDAYDPSKTPAVIRELVEREEVDMLCGPIGSGTTATITGYVAQQEIPTLALTGEEEYASPDSPIFQVHPSYQALGGFLAEFLVEEFDGPKVAVAYSPDALGEPFLEGALEQFEAAGIDAESVQFSPDAADQSTTAAKLKATGADFVMINHTSNMVTSISKAAAQQGYEPRYVSTFALTDTRLGELASGTLDDLLIGTPFLIGSEPEAEDFREAVEEYTDLSPTDPMIVQGWTAADACGQVLESVIGSSDSKPTREEILAAMESASIDTAFVPELEWSSDKHTGQQRAQIILFDGEAYTPYQEFTAFPGVE